MKERFGEEEKENTGLQQPSVSPQVKFGAAWVNQKVFLTQMTPLCLDNHSVPMLEMQVFSAVGDRCCGAVKNSVLWALLSAQAGQAVRGQNHPPACLLPGQAWGTALV